MADITTVGTLLINEALPEDMRRDQWRLDKKGTHKLFMELAEKHPDQYKQVLRELSNIGKTAVWTEGLSVSLAKLRRSRAKEQVLRPVRQKIRAILDDPSLSDTQRKDAIIDQLVQVSGPLQDAVLEEARAEGSPFAVQVDSGARGKKGSLSSLRGADLLATDQRDKFIPVPLMHSYAEGFTPAEYFAASYGQRKGQLDVKMCLSGSTLVRMADWSVKRIDEITPDEWVMGADIQGVQTPVRVARVFDNGVREVVDARFHALGLHNGRDDLVLRATPDHELLTQWRSNNAYDRDSQPKKRRLKDAKFYTRKPRNPFVAVPARTGCTSDSDGQSEPRAALLGVMLGDRCCTRRYSLSCGDPSLIQDLPFSDWGLDPRAPKSGYTYVLASTTKHPFVRDSKGRVVGTGNPIFQWLDSIGLRGGYAWEKHVPEAVWSWSSQSVAELVGGILASDGCVSATRGGVSVGLVSSSYSLCMSVRELLRVRLGIYVPMPTELPVRDCMKRPQWMWKTSSRSEVEAISRLVPIPGEKGRRLQSLLKQASLSNKPFGFRLDELRAAGAERTWDLEVDHPDHLFVLANGLVVGNSTADAGYLNKQLVNATHRQVVTRDVPEPSRLPTGLPVDTRDRDNIGAVLAHKAGKYDAGTVLTDEILGELEDNDIDEILVYSPLTERSADGGISAWAAGRRQKQGMHQIGDNIGIPAAQAIGERLSQGALSSKHSAGVGTRINKSGMEYINRLIQSPQNFPEAGPLAEHDGTVDDITKAPQGGHYIKVGDQQYYAAPDLEVKVRVGDQVEQGDDLTDGTPHPSDLVRLRGMGEARRVYLQNLREALSNSGAGAHRRNIESVAAGLLNWAQITEPDGVGDAIYGDIVPYDKLMAEYQPRQNALEQDPSKAIGKYLEEPVLHYTPGTRVTRKVADRLKKWGIRNVFTHSDPPPFEPYMVRGVLGVYHDPDWRTRQAGFYTARAFERSLHRGLESDLDSTSFVPNVAQTGTFGSQLGTQGKYGAWTSDENRRRHLEKHGPGFDDYDAAEERALEQQAVAEETFCDTDAQGNTRCRRKRSLPGEVTHIVTDDDKTISLYRRFPRLANALNSRLQGGG